MRLHCFHIVAEKKTQFSTVYKSLLGQELVRLEEEKQEPGPLFHNFTGMQQCAKVSSFHCPWLP